jgi:transposase
VLLLPGSVRILLASEPADMRNGIDGLASIAQGAWREDVYAGSYFVFLSRRRDSVKILTWDNGGFVVFYKRLEAGRFRRPITAEGDVSVKLDSTQLAMLLDGIDLSRVRRSKKWDPGDRQTPQSLISPARWRDENTTASGRSATKRSPSSTRDSPARTPSSSPSTKAWPTR